MSESSQMQPGWYYAQGDEPGTQRYWDGTQWVGDPQPVAQQQDSYGYGTGSSVGVPAEYGTRFVAWLIDAGISIGIAIVGFIVVAIGSAISDTLGGLLTVVLYIGLFGFQIWNSVIRQGQTGQTLGKTQQNIKLVADDSGGPVGGGMAFVRLLLQWVFSILCYIPLILDYLWPLWDDEKKRLSDKILKFSVVNN